MCPTGGPRSRAAPGLGERVADVRRDGARTQEELVSDLAVRASDCNQAQDLEFSSRQATVLEAAGGRAAEALIDRLAGGCEIRSGPVGEGPCAEPLEAVVGAGE